MALHICQGCFYSTKVKCNFAKHVASCKSQTEDIKLKQFEIELREEYTEKLKLIQENYDAIIKTLTAKKEKKAKMKTKEDYRLEMMKYLDKKGISYQAEWSLERLRKRSKEVRIYS